MENDRNLPNLPRTIPRRLIDEIPPRDPSHEVAPVMPPPNRSDGERIADQSIAVVDEAASMVLGKFQELKDMIAEAEQKVLNSQVEVRDTIRTHMRIVEAAMKCQQQIREQITEAVAPLVRRD